MGQVKDTGYDNEGKMALVVTKPDAQTDDYLSIDDIRSIGEIILLKDSSASIAQSKTITGQATQGPKVCPNCKFENKPEAKFCVKCATKLT